jgi:LAS superfamily LD-carboxypeptidase LdcB
MNWNLLSLTGRSRDHIFQNESPRYAIHNDAVAAFGDMRAAASTAGIDLEIFSGFRDFDAQLSIWNRKFRGERRLHDRNGQPLDHAQLTPEAIVDAILIWSALPGASRHHWGTEIDVIDRAALSEGQSFDLLPVEYAQGNVFGKLNMWLDANIESFGFFRPYREFRGGVSPEPWHLSYAPISHTAMQQYDLSVLRHAIMSAEIEGKSVVLSKLDAIYQSYVLNICEPLADEIYPTAHPAAYPVA